MGWQHILALFGKTPEVSHVALCVMWVLAKMADDRGESYPSIAYIAEKTKLSVRSVKRGLKELKDAGLVSWDSGKGAQRVNKYWLADRVVNLSTKVPDRHHYDATSATQTPLTAATSATQSNKGATQSNKGDCVAHGRYQEDTSKLVSEYVSTPPSAGQTETAEEVLAKQGKKHAEGTPPSAAGKEQVRAAYETLLKTEGWKPNGRKDAEWAAWCCWKLGASGEEAKAFARFNNVRRWSAVSAVTSVKQLAKEWVKAWRTRDPEGWARESEKRLRVVG